MTVTFRKLEEVAPLLTLKLRYEDQRELETMYSGYTANQVLALSWSSSLWVMVAEVDGEIVSVFGLTPEGNPWMVGTDKMMAYPVTIVKAGYKYVAKCLEDCAHIWNYVDCRNIQHIRWLSKLGFRFTGDTVKLNGTYFLYFEMRRQ